MAPISASQHPSGRSTSENDIGNELLENFLERDLNSAAADAHLRMILGATDIATWEWNLRTGQICCSGNIEKLHGLQPGTGRGTLVAFLEGVHPSDRERVLNTLHQAVRDGGNCEIDYQAAGNPQRLRTRGRVIRDTAGRPALLVGICMEAAQPLPPTERPGNVTHKEALEISDERFRLLVESVKDYAIFMLDPNGHILTWNPGAERIKGYSSEEIIGKHFSLFYTPEEVRAGKPERALKTAAEQGRFEGEGWRIRKDGSRFWASVVLTALHDAQGNLRGFSKVTQDLTERKVSEDTLRELSGLVLRLQDEERSRLARELHDSTAQTLSALSLNLALVNKLASVARHPQAAKVLSESLELADQASRELRTLSYLLHPPVLDKAGLAQALRWYIDGFIQRAQIDVELEISPPELGRLPQDLELTLLRIVQECLTNVYRHSESDKAGVRLVRETAEILLEIWDQGKGLPSGTLEQNGNSTVTLGVGIRGMLERVKQLGGRMEVRSGNPGTIIEVALPAPKRRGRSRALIADRAPNATPTQ